MSHLTHIYNIYKQDDRYFIENEDATEPHVDITALINSFISEFVKEVDKIGLDNFKKLYCGENN